MALTQMNKKRMEDDEDDLESLRLAALQSLQKNTVVSLDLGPSKPREHMHQKIFSPSHRRGRGTFHQNNRGRNGMFGHNSRTINSNLISIPTEVELFPTKADTLKVSAVTTQKETFKLTLPQDRYCKKTVEKDKAEQVSSKFSRYDNSDDSESESEEEESEESDSESTGLNRAGSLEALMEELENEIKGKTVPKPDSVPSKTTKSKRRNKRLRTRTDSATAAKDLLEISIVTEPINSPEHHDVSTTLEIDVEETKENAKVSNLINETPSLNKVKELPHKAEKTEYNRESVINKPSPPRVMMRNRSPPPQHNQANSPHYRDRRNHQNNYNNTQFHSFVPHHLPMPQFVQLPYNTVPFPPFALDIIHQQPPPYLPRSLSPLAINTEALCTITKAPLSPRSAAFVLQNREIIAQRRRKKDSRSASRSLSPRRSISPLLRRTLSKSPIRNRDRSRSPLPMRRLSPLPRKLSPPHRGGRNSSPPRRRRSMSPGNARRVNNNQRKPARERRSPPIPTKPSIRDRLGIRGKETSSKVETSITSQPEVDKLPVKAAVEEAASEDPVLEARKRKFERTGIHIKDGGVIKLKKEEEQSLSNEMADSKTESTEVYKEGDILDEETLLETKVDDIFSDEQSDDENEGRFKSTDKPAEPITKSSDKTESLTKTDSSYNRRDQSQRKRRHRTPPLPEIELPQLKQRVNRSTKLTKQVLSPIDSKKIEIKIRNPTKYEEHAIKAKYDVATEGEIRQGDAETGKKRGKKTRRVDVVRAAVLKELAMEEGEVMATDSEENEERQNEDSSSDNKCADGGDLRAQLSRKRAERQNKLPIIKAIQSKLLQTALKDAIFKRVKKSKKSKHRDGALKELDSALLQQRAYCDNFYCKLTRLRLIEKEQEIMRNERVCVLHPEEKIHNSQDGKLPIHLRLGLGGSELEITTEHRKKSKKSKHRSVDQV